uniref:Uncharacterized protein n=1 Tax=Amphiprion ocellaris TaxID=80972 RepID=A0AAQ5ZP80_AMPOC
MRYKPDFGPPHVRPSLSLAQSSGHAVSFSIASVSVIILPVFSLSCRMVCWARAVPLLLLLGLLSHSSAGQEAGDPVAPPPPPPDQGSEGRQAEGEESDWGMDSLRGSFEAVSGYFDSMLEFMGGRDGVCQYRCRYGKAPLPRLGYQMPEPNGCSSYFFGLPVPEGDDTRVKSITSVLGGANSRMQQQFACKIVSRDGHGHPCHDQVLQPVGHVLRHLRLQQISLRLQVPLVPPQHLLGSQEEPWLCVKSRSM